MEHNQLKVKSLGIDNYRENIIYMRSDCHICTAEGFTALTRVVVHANGNDGEMVLQITRWSLGAEWRLGYHDDHGYETETHVGRYLGKMQWLMPYLGFDWRYRKSDESEKNWFGQVNTKDQPGVLCFGFQYTLPLLFKADARIDMDGRFRLQFMREDIPLSKRLRMALMYNSDREYMAGPQYKLTKNLALSTHFDKDMGWGVGLTMTY